MTKKHVYIGYGISDNKLVDTFIKLDEIDKVPEEALIFAKANKHTYGIGEIIDIEEVNSKFKISNTNKYLDGTDELIKRWSAESFAREQTISEYKELKKLRKDSTSIENMTLKDIIDCTSYTTRKSVITYLLSRL